MLNRKYWMMIVAFAAILLLGACGDASENDSNANLSEEAVESAADEGITETASTDESVEIVAEGSLAISGTNALTPLTQAVADKFNQTYSKIKISIQDADDDGFSTFCIGETAFHQTNRVITEQEKQVCNDNLIAYKEFEVAAMKETNETLYLYVSEDILAGMEGYEFASLYLKESPALASQAGLVPLVQAKYDEDLAKLDE